MPARERTPEEPTAVTVHPEPTVPPPGDHDLPPEDNELDAGEESLAAEVIGNGGLSLSPEEVEGLWPGAHQRGDRWVFPASERNRENPYRQRLYKGLAITTLPPLEPLVDGLLFLPGESVVYSPPKLAKTFFALDLALSTATGRPWMGRRTTQGPTLYVAAEGVGGLGARVASWCAWHDEQAIEQTSFLATAPNLLDRRSLGHLLELIAEHRPILTVLDTLARSAAGADENSAQDMGKVVEALDRIRDAADGGHVCTIHHAGKDTSRGMRGSSALLGAVDTVIELTGDSHAVRCAVAAQKDAEPAEPWWCELTQVGSSAVITQADSFAVSEGAQAKVLEVLEELPDEDRTSSRWQEMAEQAGVSKRNFYRAKKALIRGCRVAGGGARGSRYTLVEEDPRLADEPAYDDGEPF